MSNNDDEFYNLRYNVIDPYFCLKLQKFFDEIKREDILSCSCNDICTCDQCDNYVSVDKFDRYIKITDGEVELLDFMY